MSQTSRFKRPAVLVMAASIALGAAACSEPSSSASVASGSTGEAVDVVNISFATDPIEIDAGTEVIWTNRDEGVHHTVTSGTPGDKGVPGLGEEKEASPDGLFDGDLPDAGASFGFTFDDPGTYAYYCTVHSSMTGKVIVS
ncbi:MAG TPA: plastocyanin/azurin family copper-binding protein [Actinomycetota bacterium]|nr:plastocyanin/azurin family copper-binding protein [Actinomycetota bacterium]